MMPERLADGDNGNTGSASKSGRHRLLSEDANRQGKHEQAKDRGGPAADQFQECRPPHVDTTRTTRGTRWAPESSRSIADRGTITRVPALAANIVYRRYQELVASQGGLLTRREPPQDLQASDGIRGADGE